MRADQFALEQGPLDLRQRPANPRAERPERRTVVLRLHRTEASYQVGDAACSCRGTACSCRGTEAQVRQAGPGYRGSVHVRSLGMAADDGASQASTRALIRSRVAIMAGAVRSGNFSTWRANPAGELVGSQVSVSCVPPATGSS